MFYMLQSQEQIRLWIMKFYDKEEDIGPKVDYYYYYY